MLRDGVPDKDIVVTGNTVIDALLMSVSKELEIGVELNPNRRLVLVTSHRRENFGEPFRNICALRTLAENNPEVQFLYPVHPNPNVKDVAHAFLAKLPNFTLCEPLDYAPFIAAMKRAYIILTDSGGVQEEAPALGKPVLVLRDETERPEAVEQGVVKLVSPVTTLSCRRPNACSMTSPPIARWRAVSRHTVMARPRAGSSIPCVRILSNGPDLPLAVALEQFCPASA